MKEVFLVISISPDGEKNVVGVHDYDDDMWTEVFYTLDAAIDLQQNMYKDFPNSGMFYHIKKVEV